jgi:hypothetical protein
MKNINLAISAASPGMSENPNIAARIATTKQTTALCSMILSHSVTQDFRIFPDEGKTDPFNRSRLARSSAALADASG